jgi:hypothetical protein
MKALLICPADRPGVAHLAESGPLAIAPLLGKSLIEYWLEALIARGAKHVVVLVSDRPHRVRLLVGDGSRWGLKVDLVTQCRELTVAEARKRFRANDTAEWLPENEVILMDHLPEMPEQPLFDSYADWFSALKAFVPRAAVSTRIGAREIAPGVWVGLHTRIAPTAQLRAPCWIGEHTLIGPSATIGPNAIIEDRTVIEDGACVVQSVVGPETFVGEFISVQNSLASGGTVVNWVTNSCLRVPDAFLLCSLADRRFSRPSSGMVGRVLAAAAMTLTSPFALVAMAISLVRGESPFLLRLGVRPQASPRSAAFQTFAYYELTAGRNWLGRWPQFWSVARGDLAWVGNRPLRPTQALALSNNFERLWLTVPAGFISLADAHGCSEAPGDGSCAHASYYAVNAGLRLDAFVLSRGLLRVAFTWPFGWSRKETPVPLQNLVHKPQA